MIAYEELVAALTRWRERNGLPTMPAELGAPVPAAAYHRGPIEAEPIEVYDDADLLVDESDDVDSSTSDDDAIERSVEMSAPADDPATPYHDPPTTDLYGDYDSPAAAASQPLYYDDDDDYDDGIKYRPGTDSTVVAEGAAIHGDPEPGSADEALDDADFDAAAAEAASYESAAPRSATFADSGAIRMEDSLDDIPVDDGILAEEPVVADHVLGAGEGEGVPVEEVDALDVVDEEADEQTHVAADLHAVPEPDELEPPPMEPAPLAADDADDSHRS